VYDQGGSVYLHCWCTPFQLHCSVWKEVYPRRAALCPCPKILRVNSYCMTVQFSYLQRMAPCTLCIHYVTFCMTLYDSLTYTGWHCAHYAYTTSHPAWLCTIFLPTQNGTVHIMHTLRHILHGSVQFSYLHRMALCTLCIHYVTFCMTLYDSLTYTGWHCAHYAYTTSHPCTCITV